MCCQDGNAAIRQMLNESAGWSAEAEGSFFLQGQPACEELPTEAAELIITLVPVQDGEAVKGTVPPGQELPTEAAELIITLVPVQDGEAVKGTVPPGQPGTVA
jgi:hypothetical protein